MGAFTKLVKVTTMLQDLDHPNFYAFMDIRIGKVLTEKTVDQKHKQYADQELPYQPQSE